MYLTTLAPEAAVGHILRHNLADEAGRRTLAKGRVLTAEDATQLRRLGVLAVRVAVLEPGDLHEDAAAGRLAAIVAGLGTSALPPAHSRVNLLAAAAGVVAVDLAALRRVNEVDGLTLATLPSGVPVAERQRVATIKIIPFAIPAAALDALEAIAASAIVVRPYVRRRVGLILVGEERARARVERSLLPAVLARVERYGAALALTQFVAADEQAIAAACAACVAAEVELIITAGETSIMDRDDDIPRGLRAAGGTVIHHGAPVEPGNLLLLGYLGDVPLLGAPGCVRSRDRNVIDLVLPRLLAGERLGRADIIALGHGGLLP